jgi:predicted  nucleic acid-binding Zn-ribbon protein
VKSNHLKHKKSELDSIMSETAKEEEFLTEKSAEYQTQIDTRLMAAYTRIRTSVRNGLAVVSIERGASGSFSRPPQSRLRLLPEKKL